LLPSSVSKKTGNNHKREQGAPVQQLETNSLLSETAAAIFARGYVIRLPGYLYTRSQIRESPESEDLTREASSDGVTEKSDERDHKL
jgi:hypothetical protein